MNTLKLWFNTWLAGWKDKTVTTLYLITIGLILILIYTFKVKIWTPKKVYKRARRRYRRYRARRRK